MELDVTENLNRPNPLRLEQLRELGEVHISNGYEMSQVGNTSIAGDGTWDCAISTIWDLLRSPDYLFAEIPCEHQLSYNLRNTRT